LAVAEVDSTVAVVVVVVGSWNGNVERAGDVECPHGSAIGSPKTWSSSYASSDPVVRPMLYDIVMMFPEDSHNKTKVGLHHGPKIFKVYYDLLYIFTYIYERLDVSKM
jgi:hypothetical protein